MDISGPHPKEVQDRIETMVASGCRREDVYVRDNGEVYSDPMSGAMECLLGGAFAGFDAHLNAHPLRFGFADPPVQPTPDKPPGPVRRLWEACSDLNWRVIRWLAGQRR